MTIRQIIAYPDAALATVCKPVTEFDAGLATLQQDLVDTMRAAPGVGITAAHIGVVQRIFVLELSPGKVLTYVNPEILTTSSETMRHVEGSVSMPGFTEELERPRKVTLRFQDIAGEWREDTAEGFHAICIQHEVDQLDGMFWIKRLSKLKRDRLVRKWEKAQR
ncbi:peptide deformylase [Agrobacterium larrymoorei]|uniref:Peptide deformylase-like n=1 Tax=Agrobacterium larrymoorei TaxID=160699 RepID=A0A4D7DQE0_9HYPH|nr:peptide deformylase [Agrobacterium larrymoorei]QCI97937.1 peptide deformylase [Agrobacterium larrymoorei]QYA06613.1 peptide deformylase [Agrobacterium larrymoorei]